MTVITYPPGDSWDRQRKTYVHNSVVAEEIAEGFEDAVIKLGTEWTVQGVDDESYADGAGI